MITIFAIQGCNKCKELIEILNIENIDYRVYYDEDIYEDIYDYIENIVECNVYPIIGIQFSYDLSGRIGNDRYIVSINSKSNEPYVLKYNNINEAVKLIKQNI